MKGEFRSVSNTTIAKHGNLPRRLAMGCIRLYQITLSPYLGRQCRFYPTCSHYAMEAIERHGVIRGTALASRRLLRCQPFHPGGVDLVPVHSCSRHKES
jgi:uncharacterized protein